MIADGWTGLLLFLLLAAPGLLFDLRARPWRVSSQESAFEEIGRITLASLGFTAVGAVVAWGAWHLPFLHFDYLLFATDEKYAWEHGLRALGVLAISTLIACGAAVLFDMYLHWRATKKDEAANLNGHTEWYNVFRADPPTGTKPWVQVDLLDGTSWRGWVERYSADTKDEVRALVLSGRLSVTRPKEKPGALPEEWTRVIIEGSQIATIAVQYLEPPARAEKAKPKKRRRCWLRRARKRVTATQ